MSLLHAIRKRYSVTADPLRTQRRIELAAVLLGCLLCLQVAYDGVRLLTLEMPEAVEPAADSMRVPGVRTSETVAASERRELVGRPLFWAGRRPVEVVDIPEDTPAEDATASELRDVKQVGVFGSGEEAGIIALVKGKKRRILLGETLDGVDLLQGLAVHVTALGVADQHAGHADVLEHGDRNLTGEGAGGLLGSVLRADGDARASAGLQNLGQVHVGRKERHVHIAATHNALAPIAHQLLNRLAVQVHLPVASDQRLTGHGGESPNSGFRYRAGICPQGIPATRRRRWKCARNRSRAVRAVVPQRPNPHRPQR